MPRWRVGDEVAVVCDDYHMFKAKIHRVRLFGRPTVSYGYGSGEFLFNRDGIETSSDPYGIVRRLKPWTEDLVEEFINRAAERRDRARFMHVMRELNPPMPNTAYFAVVLPIEDIRRGLAAYDETRATTPSV